MAELDSLAQAVLADLGFVLFARAETGELRLLGKTPGWLAALWPAIARSNGILPLADASPFLENFLIDAEECWQKGSGERSTSGPWVEQDSSGAEVQLEATAMNSNGQPILLLERLGEKFEAKKSVLQRARETVIAHQRLNSEIQKKEILLHCVADEMTATLANIITSLRLIELEDNGPRTKMLLGLAGRATHEQQTLIHRILGVFEDELRASLTSDIADANAALQRALEEAAPLFAEKGVALKAPEKGPRAAPVSADPAHLERLFANLLENALERSSAGGSVIVRAIDERESLLWEFEDNGAPIDPETNARLLVDRVPAGRDSSPAALRLHFCRIVVENCGGEIGASLREGGNAFWIRLTKSSEAR